MLSNILIVIFCCGKTEGANDLLIREQLAERISSFVHEAENVHDLMKEQITRQLEKEKIKIEDQDSLLEIITSSMIERKKELLVKNLMLNFSTSELTALETKVISQSYISMVKKIRSGKFMDDFVDLTMSMHNLINKRKKFPLIERDEITDDLQVYLDLNKIEEKTKEYCSDIKDLYKVGYFRPYRRNDQVFQGCVSYYMNSFIKIMRSSFTREKIAEFNQTLNDPLILRFNRCLEE